MSQATPEQVVAHFVEIDDVLEALRFNWNTNDRFTQGAMWDIGNVTYINGVVMMLDADTDMGFLLEVIEKDTGVVSYIAIATFAGKCNECGSQAHSWMVYPDYVGTHSEREIETIDAVLWAATALNNMFMAGAGLGPWDSRAKVHPQHNEGCLYLDDGIEDPTDALADASPFVDAPTEDED